MAQDPRFLGIMFQVCLESGTSFHQGHPVQSPVIIESITKAFFQNRNPTKWFFSGFWLFNPFLDGSKLIMSQNVQKGENRGNL